MTVLYENYSLKFSPILLISYIVNWFWNCPEWCCSITCTLLFSPLSSILLFSKVRSFNEAESFSSQWLKAQNGWSINQYCSVLEMYIKRVYITQGQWKAAREYVETNTVLSPERKMRYLKYLAELQQQKESSSTNSCKNAKHSSPGMFKNISLSIFTIVSMNLRKKRQCHIFVSLQ